MVGFSTGNHFVQYRATDNAGRVEATQLIAFKVDAVKPSVNITKPAEGASYPLDKVVDGAYKCTDGSPASTPASAPSPTGRTSTPRRSAPHTFTVTGTDKAGNVTTVTTHYSVTYTWNGFFAPVSNTDTRRSTSCTRAT